LNISLKEYTNLISLISNSLGNVNLNDVPRKLEFCWELEKEVEVLKLVMRLIENEVF
jgi:hypothetical protein